MVSAAAMLTGSIFTLAALSPAQAQAPAACDLATLFSHLSEIQGGCCTDIEGNECASGYPGGDDACSQSCGEMFEPFWDSTFLTRPAQTCVIWRGSGCALLTQSALACAYMTLTSAMQAVVRCSPPWASVGPKA